MSAPEPQAMLTPAQVGALYGVDPKTVTRWARAGRLVSVTTPGGHRRFPSAQFAGVKEMRRAGEAAGRRATA